MSLPRRLARSPFAAALGLGLAAQAGLASTGVGVPVGDEFRANQQTAGHQGDARVAADASGDFVVVWRGYDADGHGIFARRYDANGKARGKQFQVNQFTTGFQTFPDVAMDADGDFVVTWQSYDFFYDALPAQDGDGVGIVARRYRANGTPKGDEFVVNTYTTGNQVGPRVAMSAGGRFVITWSTMKAAGKGRDVFAQRFSASGGRLGDEFRVNANRAGHDAATAVAMAPDGSFLVALVKERLSDGQADGYIRRFAADGTALTDDLPVTASTAGNQRPYGIALDAEGDDGVVVWMGDGTLAGDYEVYARRFDGAGTFTGAKFQVNEVTAGRHTAARVAMDADGDFFVVWKKENGDGNGDGVFGRSFDRTGQPLTGDLPLNTWTTGNQWDPAIAVDADGDVVAAWVSYQQDGSGQGVYARRFSGPERVNLAVTLSGPASVQDADARLSYTVTVTNGHAASSQPAPAPIADAIGLATNVRLHFPLAPTASFAGIPNSAAKRWRCEQVKRKVECTRRAPLEPASADRFSLRLHAPQAAHVVQEARLWAAQFDPRRGNNTASVETQLCCEETASARSR